MPELVIKGGRTMLVSDRLQAERQICDTMNRMSWIGLQARGRYLIRAQIPRLYAIARRSLGDEIRLSGKLVTS